MPECPTGAVKREGQDYWIDPELCNNCEGFYDAPQCVVHCPIETPPVPLQSKKGRWKEDDRIATSPDLFLDGKTNPFASAIVIWEGCNILAQRQSLAWKTDTNGQLYYERLVKQGRGSIKFWLNGTADARPSSSTSVGAPMSELDMMETMDIRAACLHLIYAAHVVALERPWEQEFIINDRQIEQYLALEKRRDLNKAAKLILIREWVQQACAFNLEVEWAQQGKIKRFSIAKSPLWQLLDIQHHLQEDDAGCRHLVGLTFRIKAGIWAKYFLNKQGCRDYSAFYQYGTLPKSLINAVMSIWQQHEGAARMMLWLLFKSKVGAEQRITVPTLMRVAYGDEKINRCDANRKERKRLLRAFENDLEVLNHYGLSAVFDPVTYPLEIQPLWAKLTDLPDDADDALEFWMNDGSNHIRLTDAAPRGKWNRLMNARILQFKLPSDWNQKPIGNEKGKSKSRYGSKRGATHKSAKTVSSITLSSEQIVAARKHLGISQRVLAEKIGKSQSWIRDVENGRFQVKPADQTILRKILSIP
jgi:DNA-binding transcriptional regulator YiaG